MISFWAKVVTLPYAGVLWLRNACYDFGLIKSIRPDIPTLCLGNIAAGGTGKTPHTELVLRLCGQDIPVAVLSRGYGRKSRGFRYVSVDDGVADVGDEPLQIKRKFPGVVVAVDRNRINGVQRIQHDYPHIRLVVLDDAFQYRKLDSSFSILLTPWPRPFTRDTLLPLGRLRDLPAQARRADMIMVTKTPPSVTAAEREEQCKLLKPSSAQPLLFSSYTYGPPTPLFPQAHTGDAASNRFHTVLAITGIAHPEPFLVHIEQQAKILEHLNFPDHHVFTKKDAARINALQAKYPGIPVYTTEKDAIRLFQTPDLTPQTQAMLWYIPICVVFCSSDEERRFVAMIHDLCCFEYNVLPL